MTEPKIQIGCPQCGAVQFHGPRCLKCKSELPRVIYYGAQAPTPPPAPERVVETVYESVTVELCASCVALAPNELLPLEAICNAYILAVVNRCGGKNLLAAKILGIGKTTLYRKLAEMNPPPHARERLLAAIKTIPQEKP